MTQKSLYSFQNLYRDFLLCKIMQMALCSQYTKQFLPVVISYDPFTGCICIFKHTFRAIPRKEVDFHQIWHQFHTKLPQHVCTLKPSSVSCIQFLSLRFSEHPLIFDMLLPQSSVEDEIIRPFPQIHQSVKNFPPPDSSTTKVPEVFPAAFHVLSMHTEVAYDAPFRFHLL